jgi:hypothetical protein
MEFLTSSELSGTANELADDAVHEHKYTTRALDIILAQYFPTLHAQQAPLTRFDVLRQNLPSRLA